MPESIQVVFQDEALRFFHVYVHIYTHVLLSHSALIITQEPEWNLQWA